MVIKVEIFEFESIREAANLKKSSFLVDSPLRPLALPPRLKIANL